MAGAGLGFQNRRSVLRDSLGGFDSHRLPPFLFCDHYLCKEMVWFPQVSKILKMSLDGWSIYCKDDPRLGLVTIRDPFLGCVRVSMWRTMRWFQHHRDI